MSMGLVPDWRLRRSCPRMGVVVDPGSWITVLSSFGVMFLLLDDLPANFPIVPARRAHEPLPFSA